MFLILGYLIRFRGRIDLVAGHREGRIRDEKGLSRVVGNSLLILGVLAAVTLVLVFIVPGTGSPPVSLLCGGCCPGCRDPFGPGKPALPEKIRGQVSVPPFL